MTIATAAKTVNRPSRNGEAAPDVARPRSVRELVAAYPDLRPSLIRGLLRRGETLNIIAAPKVGKSWLATDLALAVATGRMWLGTYPTDPGDVLIIDNELHGETSAHRIPKVAEARGIPFEEYADHLCVENLRGQLRDVYGLGRYFAALEPGRFRLVVIDAFYRAMPREHDENDNGAMAQIYNTLDSYADRFGFSFVLIHHASKGAQGQKSVTDVGAGAGAQSRATDTHLVLREHEEDGAVVLDAAVRSWQPVAPMCLRWDFPTWTPDSSLDPAALRKPGTSRRRDDDGKVAWTIELFVERFITPAGRTKDEILVDAEAAGLSDRKAARFLGAAVAKGLAYRWVFGRATKEKYGTERAPKLIDIDTENDHSPQPKRGTK